MYLTVSTTDQVQAWCNFSPGDNTVVDNGTSGDSEKDELAAYIEAIAVNKDREAFKRLFGLMAPQIKAYCIKRGSNPAAAEEMAQETMIQVWRRAGPFARRASVKTWIYTIARNKRIDHFRKEQRPELTAEDLAQGISPSLDAQDHMELAEAGETLAEKIRDLSAEQAEVIHKAFFEDKTHQVIAEELNLPLGTVKSRIRLALNKLRSSMAEHEE
jgi:RNA polymerase sigma-70 factor (ECF subfamily)